MIITITLPLWLLLPAFKSGRNACYSYFLLQRPFYCFNPIDSSVSRPTRVHVQHRSSVPQVACRQQGLGVVEDNSVRVWYFSSLLQVLIFLDRFRFWGSVFLFFLVSRVYITVCVAALWPWVGPKDLPIASTPSAILSDQDWDDS